MAFKDLEKRGLHGGMCAVLTVGGRGWLFFKTGELFKASNAVERLSSFCEAI